MDINHDKALDFNDVLLTREYELRPRSDAPGSNAPVSHLHIFNTLVGLYDDSSCRDPYLQQS